MFGQFFGRLHNRRRSGQKNLILVGDCVCKFARKFILHEALGLAFRSMIGSLKIGVVPGFLLETIFGGHLHTQTRSKGSIDGKALGQSKQIAFAKGALRLTVQVVIHFFKNRNRNPALHSWESVAHLIRGCCERLQILDYSASIWDCQELW